MMGYSIHLNKDGHRQQSTEATVKLGAALDHFRQFRPPNAAAVQIRGKHSSMTVETLLLFIL